MKIIFSLHAQLKIRQRRISRNYVIQTAVDPDFEKAGRNLRTELYRKFGKKYLKIVVKREFGDIVVVTAHWVDRVKNK